MSQQPSTLDTQNMNQQISTQQTFPYSYIITLPHELFFIISLFLDIESQLSLASVCRLLDEYHQMYCRVDTYIWAYTMDCGNIRFYHNHIEQFNSLITKTGWVTVKTKVLTGLVKPQNIYPHHVRGYLSSDFTLELSIGINRKRLNALVLKPQSHLNMYSQNISPVDGSVEITCPSDSSYNDHFENQMIMHPLNISSFGNFSNLMLLNLSNVTFENDDKVPTSLKLHSLVTMYLSRCNWKNEDLPRIFEDCPNLDIVKLSECTCLNATSLKLPPLVTTFKLKDCGDEMSKKPDISNCPLLSHLVIKTNVVVTINLHRDAPLKVVNPSCPVEDPTCLNNFQSNLKTIVLNEHSVGNNGIFSSWTKDWDDYDTNRLVIPSSFKNLRELQFDGLGFNGVTLIITLPLGSGWFTIKKISSQPAEFRFLLSLEEERQVSISLIDPTDYENENL
jgi:hypothetical protein